MYDKNGVEGCGLDSSGLGSRPVGGGGGFCEHDN
jgi:hypothetical protein